MIVLGYLGEPMARLDAAGVAINAASPTAVAVGLLAKARAVRQRDAELAAAGGAALGELARRARPAAAGRSGATAVGRWR